MEAQQKTWNFTAGRLVRPREGRMIAGVCAGFAQHYGWDPVLVRLLVAVVICLGCGTLFIAYIAAWIIMPNAPLFYVTPESPASTSNFAGSAPIS